MSHDREHLLAKLSLGTRASASVWTTVAGAIAASVALYFWDPGHTDVFAPCPVHYLMGLHCPGCGSLRALHRLLHGRVAAAFAMNPLMVLSIPFIVALLLKPSWRYKPSVPWVVFAVIVAYTIARNIPYWPFSSLAPH